MSSSILLSKPTGLFPLSRQPTWSEQAQSVAWHHIDRGLAAQIDEPTVCSEQQRQAPGTIATASQACVFWP